jgi:hypothetical protein
MATISVTGLLNNERPRDDDVFDIAPGGDSIYRVIFVSMPTKVITRDEPIVAESPEKAVFLVANETPMTVEEARATRVVVKFVSHL